MNDRVKKLMLEAGVGLVPLMEGAILDGTEKNLEKFAELIVRECADIANNVHMCRDGRVIAEDIKQHFGVEE